MKKEVIDRLFDRLFGIYGKKFTSQYSMGSGPNGKDPGLDMAKAAWADELAGFDMMALKYALDNSDPTFAPTAREFAELARKAPRATKPALQHRESPEEKARNEAAAKEFERKARDAVNHPGTDHKQWAKSINKRYLQGDRTLEASAIEKARLALGTEWSER